MSTPHQRGPTENIGSDGEENEPDREGAAVFVVDGSPRLRPLASVDACHFVALALDECKSCLENDQGLTNGEHQV